MAVDEGGEDTATYPDKTLQTRFDERMDGIDEVEAVLTDAAVVYVMRMPMAGPHATSRSGDTTVVHRDRLAVDEIPEDEELTGSEARNLYNSLREQDVYHLEQTRDGTRVERREDLTEPALEFNASFHYEGMQEDDDSEGYISFAGTLIGDEVIDRYVS